MSKFNDCQQEVGKWAEGNFGYNSSHRWPDTNLKDLPAVLGMLEELGELAGLICKAHQGRLKRMSEEEWMNAVKDALADTLVFMSDFACRNDINLEEEFAKTWKTVKQRSQATWEDDKDRELEEGLPTVSVQSTPKVKDPLAGTMWRASNTCIHCNQPLSDNVPASCPNCGLPPKEVKQG